MAQSSRTAEKRTIQQQSAFINNIAPGVLFEVV
jgi:hypothetical protein